ncbi:type II toxin-antitoxin system RelE/ParE family toxin [Streptococcus sp. ZJ93]|uniref:type II toxin-antitoxin system RelE family toxin n=1 Tax=Streptococcus handemini TaxID=3161188 RepID=UPI0032EC0317
MTYKLVPTPKFVNQLKKLDSFTVGRIKAYLEGVVEEPRAKGKGLKANRSGQWRYRIGDYRAIVNIKDDVLVILALEVGHRRDTY